ncbi:MAG: hypothetical protein HYY87_00730 [Candidatus Levybacteria bacterium]|nr:hypothetical protein [Candidatus Levybacteria bacterium]
MSEFRIRTWEFRILGAGYVIIVIGLFLYSFTQVDLGLTLTQWSIWQVLQTFFQQIGYFQRPLSTALYIALVLLLSIFYLLFLRLAHEKKIAKREVWSLILIMSFILTFSYNAFSYDLFNYVFDAKIVTYYQQNPYEHKALDYLGEPMLSFMHWTHRTYPYGPIWLAVTVPLSYLGFGFLLPTLILFKTLATLSFLGTAFFIGKILQKISKADEMFGIIFFALNPLVIIEGLVAAHNDIFMMFFAIASIYFLISNHIFRSVALLVLSIGVKFATIFFAPIVACYYLFLKQRRQIPWDKYFLIAVMLMVIPVIVASIRTNFQPWYLLYVLPFAALAKPRYFILIPSVIVSLFALFQYVPFLYLGNWDPPVPSILFWIMVSSIIASVVFTAAWFLKRKW